MKTVEELITSALKAYRSGKVTPIRRTWVSMPGVDKKIHCCGLTAACVQEENLLKKFPDGRYQEKQDEVGNMVREWVRRTYGVSDPWVDGFTQGFDGWSCLNIYIDDKA